MKLPEFILWKIWSDAVFKEIALPSGERLKIIERGEYTGKHGGPDFSNTRISINEIIFSGSVEIDTIPQNWILHKHNLNPSFNDVILHITGEQSSTDITILNSNGRKIISVPISELLNRTIKEELADLIVGRKISEPGGLVCAGESDKIPSSEKDNIIAELGIYRFSQKCSYISELFSSTKDNLSILYDLSPKNEFIWKYILAVMLFRAMGYSANTQTMENLFKLINPVFFVEYSEDKGFYQLFNSYTFTMSGLLPELHELTEDESIHYVRQIKEYWHKINKYLHASSIPASAWKFGGIRPHSSPYRRINSAVKLSSKIWKLKLDEIFEIHDNSVDATKLLRNLRSLLSVEPDDFWKTHSNFKVTSKTELTNSFGSNRVDEIIINTLLPFYYSYGLTKNAKSLSESCRHIYVNSLMRVESGVSENMKKGLQLNLQMNRAVNYQGAIELYKNFCIKGRCSECKIGERVFF